MTSLAGSYKLISAKGEKAPEHEDIALHLTNAEGLLNTYELKMRVANGLKGNVKYEDGFLKGALMSTEMLGTPFQMGIEDGFCLGLVTDGLKVTTVGDELTLANKDDKFVFQRFTY